MTLLLYLFAAPVIAWLLILLFERANVYRPQRRLPGTPADFGLEFEDVTFVADDGTLLNGWWIPAENARGTVLYCHGNAGNIGTRANICAGLCRLPVNVFIFDYRGYGRSRGVSTERGTYRDACAAYEFVRARHDDAENPPVIVYGGSLGGAIATQLALDKSVKGIVLENTFTSVPDLGERLYPWLPVRMFGYIRYDTRSKIARVTPPKLIAHSRDDALIPYDMGEALFKLAAQPKTFVSMSGPHGEAGWDGNPQLWVALERFVQTALPAQ